MGKRFYKIKNPITGHWESPKDYDKPVVPVLPIAKLMTSDGYKAFKTISVIDDPRDLNFGFGSPGGRGIPGLFDNVKARFKEAILRYVARDWLTESDLAEIGLEKMSTKLDGLKFPTKLTEHNVERKVERTREKFNF